MSDKKISELALSTTPLAGTEVLPVVQSGVTKKVAIDDLTVKNLRSNATTGILQMAGVTAGQTRVVTVPDANFTAARTDAAQSLTGDQTLSTGNLVIGTAGKGIDFSADGQAAGMTSELLDDYEEGTWTPSLGGDATYTVQEGYYTKIGNVVHVRGAIRPDVIGTGSTSTISGLPFTSNAGYQASVSVGFFDFMPNNVIAMAGFVNGNASTLTLYGKATASTAYVGETVFADGGGRIAFSSTYFV